MNTKYKRKKSLSGRCARGKSRGKRNERKCKNTTRHPTRKKLTKKKTERHHSNKRMGQKSESKMTKLGVKNRGLQIAEKTSGIPAVGPPVVICPQKEGR